MDFRIIELEDTVVYGVSKQYEGVGYKTRKELRHPMWDETLEDVPGQICSGKWNDPNSTIYDGLLWLGKSFQRNCLLKSIFGILCGIEVLRQEKHMTAKSHLRKLGFRKYIFAFSD